MVHYVLSSFRCPSAPPLEETLFMAAEICSLNCGVQQRKSRRLGSNIQVSDNHCPPGGSALISLRDGAPQLAGGIHLYPSLTLWMETPDPQVRPNRCFEAAANQVFGYISNLICIFMTIGSQQLSCHALFPWRQHLKHPAVCDCPSADRCHSDHVTLRTEA